MVSYKCPQKHQDEEHIQEVQFSDLDLQKWSLADTDGHSIISVFTWVSYIKDFGSC